MPVMKTPPQAYVLGWPAKHSRSPKIHSYWLHQLNRPGSYTYREIAPEHLATEIARLRAEGFAGANVTVPHKEAVFALCDTLSSRARAVGAVNTLWLQDGQLHGDNTDIYGFSQNLTDFAPAWQQGKTACVLGAGGAARGVVYALIAQGYQHILLANRTRARAEDFARLWPQVEPIDWDQAPQHLSRADLLVNTTSLGMQGQPALDFSLAAAPPHLIVNDIVYVPLQTELLRAARAQGLQAVDGLGMLLHQAVPGFEHWFGVRPQVSAELRRLIEQDIPA